jgi:hypothetical protein
VKLSGVDVKRLAAFLLCLGCALSAWAEQVSLFDRAGVAVGYIDAREAHTVFLANGNPVAYVTSNSLYGFNGAHLGWIEQGVIWNHNGEAVGYARVSADLDQSGQSPKRVGRHLPTPLMRDVEPLKPSFRVVESTESLAGLLAQGVRD